jgi:hypothetical protein
MLLEIAGSLAAFKRLILGRTDPLGRTCLRQIKGDAGLGLEEKACCVLKASMCGADCGRATRGPRAPVPASRPKTIIESRPQRLYIRDSRKEHLREHAYFEQQHTADFPGNALNSRTLIPIEHPFSVAVLVWRNKDQNHRVRGRPSGLKALKRAFQRIRAGYPPDFPSDFKEPKKRQALNLAT